MSWKSTASQCVTAFQWYDDGINTVLKSGCAFSSQGSEH